VPPQYDSLLAKLVVSGTDRAQALARLRSALARCQVDGVATTLPMLSRMVDDAEWAEGGVDSGWLERGLGQWLEAGPERGQGRWREAGPERGQGRWREAGPERGQGRGPDAMAEGGGAGG
jgi:acetyl/propionyl-CoA carboxylase alpha subunit